MDEQEALEQQTRAKWETLRPSFAAWAAESGESPSEFDRIVEDQVEYARVRYQKQRAVAELKQSSVIWDRITGEEANSLQALLDTNPDEAAMHHFLVVNPRLLVQVMAGGHGRYQLSKKRLGAEFVPDFLIAETSSMGIEWHAVELESPSSVAHRRDGLPANSLNLAIAQIRDWRKWVMNNLDYARRSQAQDGLGLAGIDPRMSGIVLIGRRHLYPDRFNEFRRQMIDREHILIHSYDWLVDVAQSNKSGSLRMGLSHDLRELSE